MKKNTDILLLSCCSKVIDYPALALPQLTGFLRAHHVDVIQTDLNLLIKDEVLTEPYLWELYTETLPLLLMENFHCKDDYIQVREFYQLLSNVMQENGFKKLEKVKKHLQARRNKKLLDESFMKDAKIIFRISKHLDFLFSIVPYIFNTSSQFIFSKKLQNLITQEITRIITINPLIIGFSVITTQNSFSLWLSNEIKSTFKFTGSIVFGGSQPTKFQELFLKNNQYIDFVISGEGEEALLQLVKSLKGKDSLENIPRLVYRDSSGKIISNKNQKYLADNYSFSFPDYDGLPLDKYLAPVFPIMGSTNCPWKKCSFCAHRTSFKEDYNKRNARDIVAEMKFMYAKYKIKIFHFADETMTRHQGVEISKIIQEEKLPFLWMAFGRLDDEFDRETLEQFYKGGARVIEWGLESASDKVLEKMNKGITVAKAQEILIYAALAGIKNKILTWHNYPGESVEDVIKTIYFVEKNVHCGFAIPMLTLKQQLVLQVGSPLYDQVFQENGQLKYFDKVWYPNSEYSINAKYLTKNNSDIEKKQVIGVYLKRMKKYCDTHRIFIAFNENVTFDLLLCDLKEGRNDNE